MTKQEQIREGIENILIKYKKSLHKEGLIWKSKANVDFRKFAAEDIMQYLHSQGVVIKVEGELPDSKDFHWYNDWGGQCGRSGFELALKEIKEAAYVAVEPLF